MYTLCFFLICSLQADEKTELQTEEEAKVVYEFSDKAKSFNDILAFASNVEKDSKDEAGKQAVKKYMRILQRMIKESNVNEKHEIKLLISSLRNEFEFDTVIMNNPKSPAAKLRSLGYSSVPFLIAAIDDDSFTRSVSYRASTSLTPGEGHVVRVGDCAKAILVEITGAKYGDWFVHSPYAKVPPRQVQRRYQEWWNKHKKDS